MPHVQLSQQPLPHIHSSLPTLHPSSAALFLAGAATFLYPRVADDIQVREGPPYTA